MTFSPIHSRLLDKRFVLKNGTLSVENSTKRSCLYKFFHRKQYDSEKILAALQSFYSKSLTEDEAKCLKKNIHATLRQAAKENVKTQQMSSFTRWLFHKHVVDLKPYTQTFEKLQSRTFRPKWQEQKDAYNQVRKELKELQQTDLHHALIAIPFVKKHIQAGLKAIKGLQQLHRPIKDITKITAIIDAYNQRQVKLKEEIAKVDDAATEYTNTLMKKVNAKNLKKSLEKLESHYKPISLSGLSLVSRSHTKKAIKKCQKTLSVLNNPIYQMNVVLDKVKQLPSQTPLDIHYGDKAKVCIAQAKLELEKIQKTLPVNSTTYQQIQEELAALEEARQSLHKSWQTMYSSLVTIKPLEKIKYVSLEAFLTDDALFLSEKEKLHQMLNTLNPPIKYDVISKFFEKFTQVFDAKYDEFKKSFNFDDYVAKTIGDIQSQLVANVRNKYPVDADFAKNTSAIHSMAVYIGVKFDINFYLSPIFTNHAYHGKLLLILKQKRLDTEKELFAPFYKVLTHVQLKIGNDLQTLVTNWQTMQTVKDQYRYLKVCDPTKACTAFINPKIKEIEDSISQIFSDRIKEIETLADEFQKKSIKMAAFYLLERTETLEKMNTIAKKHNAQVTTSIPLVDSYEKKMKAAIGQFTIDTQQTAQFMKDDLLKHMAISYYAYDLTK